MKAISQVLIPQRSLEATADICILSDPLPLFPVKF
jgi:hypothetical protein